MSVFSVFGAFQEMKGRRIKPAGLNTRDFMALMTFCWRRARVRSFSLGLHRLWRVRARASACRPSMWVVPRRGGRAGRRRAVDGGRPAAQARGKAAVLEAAVDLRDHAAAGVVDAPHRIDEG